MHESARPEPFAHQFCSQHNALLAIMENTDAQLAYLDADFNFITVNSAYAAGSGYRRDELVGRNHFELFPDDENELIFRRARNTRTPVECKAKAFRYHDQPWRGVTYWDWRLTPVEDDDGSLQGLVLSLLDVTRQTRSRQASDALNRVNDLVHSTLDFDDILGRTMPVIAETSGCEFIAVGLRECDGSWHLPEVFGLPERLRNSRFPEEDFPASTESLMSGGAVQISDGPEATIASPRARELGIRALMLAPLSAPDRLFGVLAFGYTSGPAVFDEQQIDLARKTAASLSLALGNARLFESERAARERANRALERTELLLRAAHSLTASAGLRRVLQELAAVAMKATGRTRVSVSLYDAGTDELVVQVGTPSTVPPDTRIPVEHFSAPARECIRNLRPAVIDYDSAELAPEDRERIAAFDTHVCLAAPLVIGDRLIGYLSVDEPGDARPFLPSDLEIMEAIASHAAVVIENARLYEEEVRRAAG